MSASHPPSDLLRGRNGRWHKRRMHLPGCTLKGEMGFGPLCQCPSREPLLYRNWRCMRGGQYNLITGEFVPGAWTFEDVYSHGERDREEVTVDWDAELRVAREVELIIQRAMAYADMASVSSARFLDARHYCTLEAERYIQRFDEYPDPYFLAYRLCLYFGMNEQAERFRHMV